MFFNSLEFLIFFPLVLILYYSIKHRYRWILLLIASYYFYMSWKPEYVILIMASTIVDYISALKIHNSDSIRIRKLFLGLSIAVNLGILFFFKYFNFFNQAVHDIVSRFAIPFDPLTLKVLLPIGISFYTFQTLSYTIDVYRGEVKPQRHLGIFSVYVSFFPQLVAGPIERAKNLMPQFFEKHKLKAENISAGLKQTVWGFFKKLVVADNLAFFVDKVYGAPEVYTFVSLVLATVFFAIQVFADFSGYCDIALGVARMMGFRLTDNFRNPFSSRSIADFWRRWHITLSYWFRDYVYIPLGGSKVSNIKWARNIFIVFLLVGLWHGASWTFLAFGASHAALIVLGKWTLPLRNRISKLCGVWDNFKLRDRLNIIGTFIIFCLTVVFFRAQSIADSMVIFKGILLKPSTDAVLLSLHLDISTIVILVFFTLILLFVNSIKNNSEMRTVFFSNVYLKWPVYIIIVLMILLFAPVTADKFIYFQF
ncbi:MAG: MBOAT family O-acyltransferase [Nanobdellota archaeon]